MKKHYATGYRKWNGSLWDGGIRTNPANDDWKPMSAEPAKSTRKEHSQSPNGPEELDDGYFDSLLQEAV